MNKRAKLLVAGLSTALLGIGAAGVAAANGGDEDRPLRGASYDRATSAALDLFSVGTVTNTEAGDDGEAYEVDVRRADGSQVEVELDGNFNVTATEADDVNEEADIEGDEDQDEGTGDDEGSDDD